MDSQEATNNSLTRRVRRYHKQESYPEKLERYLDQSVNDLPDFLKGFLPSLVWLPKYNRLWLVGDIISGFTVGVMLVPQSVAYARLAQLPVEHGLYASFIANIMYALVGGSREIAVGPNAVLSLMVANIIQDILNQTTAYSAVDIAVALSVLLSFVSILLGVLRLGIILDLIPSPVILGFTTGAALTIMMSQFGSMLGIPNINTTKKSWEIIYDIFSNLVKLTYVNLIFGILSLGFLFVFPVIINKLSFKFPRLQTIGVASNAIAVIVFTLVSFTMLNIDSSIPLSVVGKVPSGFGAIQLPNMSSDLWSYILKSAPGLFLVAILEHTAVCKNFSAQVGYQVSTSQEFFAVGVCNFMAGIFSGFPVAGSLSRGAVLSKSGVKSPLVGLFIGLVLVAAFCFLTPAFFYIPSATLGAVIMRAGLSLLPSLSKLNELWTTRAMDFLIFTVAAVVTFLLGVQYGIGAAVAIAFVDLVYRIARPKFYILGEIQEREGVFVDKAHPAYTTHDPEPGVLVFRIQESILFPNIGYLNQQMMDHVVEFTKSLGPPNVNKLWSSDSHERALKLRVARSKRTGVPVPNEKDIPPLRAVILDLGAVNAIDASGLQGLRELREQLYMYSGAHPSQAYYFRGTLEDSWELHQLPHFQLHFVSIHTRVLRALVLSGLPRPLASYPDQPRSSHDDSEKPELFVETNDDVVSFSIPPHQSNWPEPMAELARSFISQNNHVDEPIILETSPYIHLTVSGAVRRIRSTLPKKFSFKLNLELNL